MSAQSEKDALYAHSTGKKVAAKKAEPKPQSPKPAAAKLAESDQ